ncbi:hypothetical protein V6Z98_009167 [Aspergillus fumigatus]
MYSQNHDISPGARLRSTPQPSSPPATGRAYRPSLPGRTHAVPGNPPQRLPPGAATPAAPRAGILRHRAGSGPSKRVQQRDTAACAAAGADARGLSCLRTAGDDTRGGACGEYHAWMGGGAVLLLLSRVYPLSDVVAEGCQPLLWEVWSAVGDVA